MAGDAEFAAAVGLTGVNSYNLGRPVAQAVHYFWTYFRVMERLGRLRDLPPLHVVLPTGAMGNVAGGTIARAMGLPLERMCLACNANDITHRAISRGEFHRSDQMLKTLSDAINIQVPYNFERLLWFASGGDLARVSGWMAEMDATGRLTVPPDILAALQGVYGSARVDDDEMLAELRRTHAEDGYLCCPNTAVAVAAARRLGYGAPGAPPCALLATAHPCKFEESVTAAVGADAWQAFERGGGFPPAATALLSRAELPLHRLAVASGGLADAQREWEREIRAAHTAVL